MSRPSQLPCFWTDMTNNLTLAWAFLFPPLSICFLKEQLDPSGTNYSDPEFEPAATLPN